MSKRVKNLITTELEKKFQGQDAIVIVDYTGINATVANQLRGALKKKKVKMTVVRNAMAAKALGQGPFAHAAALLTGTNAIVYGGESIVDVVKELVEQAKKIEKLKIKASVVEGKILDSKDTAALAKMPNKKELKGIIVAQILGPGRKLAGQLKGPAGKLAGQVKAVIEKKEKEAPAAAPVAAPVEPAAAAPAAPAAPVPTPAA